MSLAPDARILIVLMGSLGDAARGLSLVAPLRNALPQGRIAWLVEPLSAPLVRLMSGVDDVIVFDRPRGVWAVPELRRALRSFQPTIVLDLQRHFKSGFFSRLSGAPRRIGFHRSDAKEGNWLFQTETIKAAGEELPKIEHYGLFLQQLGIQAPLDEAPLRAAELPHRLLGERPYVAVVLGSAWPTKDWPAEGYQRLVGEIARQGQFDVVLLGDKKRRALGDELVRAVPNGVMNLAGETTIPELAGVLRGAAAAVGPDSGPGHIAAATGRPYVALFGPTSPDRTAPRGSRRLAVVSPAGCAGCYRRRCPGLDTVCMRLISPHAVWEQLRAVLGFA